MADLSVTVTDFTPQISQTLNVVGAQAFGAMFPNTKAAMNAVAHMYHKAWREASTGVKLPGMPYAIRSRGDYTKSIQVDVSDENVKEISASGSQTEWIESGHGEIDLKPGLIHGPKARQGVRGPYNIVAFRHGTPDSLPSNNPMPVNVYNLIKKETDKADKAYASGQSNKPGTSRITVSQKTPSSQKGGKPTITRSYQWGSSVPESAGGTRETKQTSQGDYQWKTGKHTGMRRMAASTSGAKSSSYITFRVVSIHSDPASWIVPPLPANPIRQAVVDSLEEEVKGILKAAMEEDFAAGGA